MDAIAILQRLESGAFLERLAKALVHVGGQVVESGNKGRVNVVLEISQTATGDVAVIVAATIREALPVRKPRGAIFYAVEGTLADRDIRQAPLPELRVVTDDRPTRSIDTNTGEIREA